MSAMAEEIARLHSWMEAMERTVAQLHRELDAIERDEAARRALPNPAAEMMMAGQLERCAPQPDLIAGRNLLGATGVL